MFNGNEAIAKHIDQSGVVLGYDLLDWYGNIKFVNITYLRQSLKDYTKVYNLSLVDEYTIIEAFEIPTITENIDLSSYITKPEFEYLVDLDYPSDGVLSIEEAIFDCYQESLGLEITEVKPDTPGISYRLNDTILEHSSIGGTSGIDVLIIGNYNSPKIDKLVLKGTMLGICNIHDLGYGYKEFKFKDTVYIINLNPVHIGNIIESFYACKFKSIKFIGCTFDKFTVMDELFADSIVDELDFSESYFTPDVNFNNFLTRIKSNKVCFNDLSSISNKTEYEYTPVRMFMGARIDRLEINKLGFINYNSDLEILGIINYLHIEVAKLELKEHRKIFAKSYIEDSNNFIIKKWILPINPDKVLYTKSEFMLRYVPRQGLVKRSSLRLNIWRYDKASKEDFRKAAGIGTYINYEKTMRIISALYGDGTKIYPIITTYHILYNKIMIHLSNNRTIVLCFYKPGLSMGKEVPIKLYKLFNTWGLIDISIIDTHIDDNQVILASNTSDYSTIYSSEMQSIFSGIALDYKKLN